MNCLNTAWFLWCCWLYRSLYSDQGLETVFGFCATFLNWFLLSLICIMSIVHLHRFMSFVIAMTHKVETYSLWCSPAIPLHSFVPRIILTRLEAVQYFILKIWPPSTIPRIPDQAPDEYLAKKLKEMVKDTKRDPSQMCCSVYQGLCIQPSCWG